MRFVDPEMEIVKFENVDIIATSGDKRSPDLDDNETELLH